MKIVKPVQINYNQEELQEANLNQKIKLVKDHLE